MILRTLMIVSAIALTACSGTASSDKNTDRLTNLAGSEWGLGEDLPFIKFAADGNVSGNGGCNHFRGTYTIQGDKLSLSALAATKRACFNLQDEDKFFKVLDQVARFQATHTRLVLKTDSGADVLVLQRRDWD